MPGIREKRKNSDKRKERSRDAARCRRGKETEVFAQLSDVIPLPDGMSTQLDKASNMRLAISYLKISKIMEDDRMKVSEPFDDESTDSKLAPQFSKALDGFLMIISKEGDIVFVSDTVNRYLGIQQIELIGQSIYEFTHPCDHEEIRDVLSEKISSSKSEVFSLDEQKFFIRMKCTLTSKGRSVNLKSASYKVIMCSGKLIISTEEPKEKKVFEEADKENLSMYPFLLVIGEAIPHPSNIEVPLDCKTFISRHSMDMKFTFCDEKVEDLIGYDSKSLIGESLFRYHHALDSDIVDKAYKHLFSKGQTMTACYRFLAKNGGFVWLVTQGTIIYNSRTQKPQCIVCVHYVLSGIECRGVVLSNVQVPKVSAELGPLKLQLSTENIFAPKTKDMEEEYFMPPELKKSNNGNEIDDLTHLAPTAGGVCVPLGFPSFKEVIDLSVQNDDNSDISTDRMDDNKPDLPFSSYRSDSDSNISNKSVYRETRELISPSSSSTPSPMVRSPSEYISTVNSNDVSLMNNFFSEMEPKKPSKRDRLSLDMLAPYIPMHDKEDLNLLPPTSDVIFTTMQNDFNPGLFGRTESIFTQAGFEEPREPKRLSLREMLNGSTAVASIEQPPDTMLLQMKRPLDFSGLEKGPPVKVLKVNSDPSLPSQKDPPPVTRETKTSVLLNLLLTGEDRNHGYSVCNPLLRKAPIGRQVDTSPNKLTATKILLPTITQEDCDVNTPITSNHLLSGPDLFEALNVPNAAPYCNQFD